MNQNDYIDKDLCQHFLDKDGVCTKCGHDHRAWERAQEQPCKHHDFFPINQENICKMLNAGKITMDEARVYMKLDPMQRIADALEQLVLQGQPKPTEPPDQHLIDMIDDLRTMRAKL